MAELKTKKTNASARAFIKALPDAQKRADAVTLLALFETITKQKPVMWGETGVGPRRKDGGTVVPSRGRVNFQQKIMRGGIIGFGQYHYKSERSTQEGDWPLIGFSPRKQNLTLYIMSGF